MSPVTHFFAGWLVAATADLTVLGPLSRREKALIVAAAVAPDLDGLGIIPELLTRHTSHPLLWFSEYHHSLHTLLFALICSAAAWVIAGPLVDFAWGPAMRGRPGRPTHPWTTAILVFVSFHLHLLCDLLGSRGPEGSGPRTAPFLRGLGWDGYQWPIPYLKPFSNAMQWTWHGQWALNAWQNFAITGVLLGLTLWVAWRFETSPMEFVSQSANRALVRTLHERFASSGVSQGRDRAK